MIAKIACYPNGQSIEIIVDKTTKDIIAVIWRGKERKQGAYHEYPVERRDNQTVLDVVTEVQRHLEPSLAYRFACRVGVCGSCAMNVNGIPRWTCRTHVQTVLDDSKDGKITIEPLRNLPVIKDLVCDMQPFFEKWQRAGGKFKGSQTRKSPLPAINPESTARQNANAAIECINCAVCYSACDVVGWNKAYAGPAAMNRIWSLLNDERQVERDSLLNKAFSDGNCGSCHSHGNCTLYCPVELNPSRSVASIKKAGILGLAKLQASNEIDN